MAQLLRFFAKDVTDLYFGWMALLGRAIAFKKTVLTST